MRYMEVVAAVSETAAKILALRSGASVGRPVQVTCDGGATASVDWDDWRPGVTLNMPSLPPDAVLSRGEADRMVAFIVHECCHVLHSSRTAWDHAVSCGARVQAWTNALDDVRIEATEIAAGCFPAMRSLLSGMVNHLHFEALTAARKAKAVIGVRVADAPYIACILGRVDNGYLVPSAAGLRGAMTADVSRLIDHALTEIRRCTSTDDVVALAQELVRMEGEGFKPQPEQGDGSEGQEGQGDGSEGQEGQGDGSEGQEGQEGQGDGSEGQEGQGDGSEGQEGQGKPQGNQGTGEPGLDSNASLAETIKEIAKRAGIRRLDSFMRHDKSHRLSTVRSEVIEVSTSPDGADRRFAAKELNDRLARNSVLSGQIGRLLVSEEVRRRTHHESSGRLDRRALSRMRAGALDVFSQRDDTPGIDTALMVLIDGSSSMEYGGGWNAETGLPNPGRIDMAKTAAWHIVKAAEAANAKVSIAAFLSGASGGGALVCVLKPWHATMSERALTLAQFAPAGRTPLSPAILECSRMLAEVNATRHILMVLTDGDCDYGAPAVTKACALAADRGVEVVGVGMNCASVTAAFPPKYSVNVEDLGQLAATGLGVLVSMLEDANPRGAD